MTLLETMLSESLVERLGWMLLDFVWQGAALAVLLAATLWVLRRRSAHARYVAGCLVLSLMAAAPVATFIMADSPPGFWYRTVATASSRDGARSGPNSVALSSESAADDDTAAARKSGDFRDLVPLPVAGDTASAQRSDSRTTFLWTPAVTWWNRAVRRLEPLLPGVVSVWLVGVTFLSVRLLGGWSRVQWLKRRAVHPIVGTLHETVLRLSCQLRVSRPVRLLESAAVQVPTVIGWFWPVILVPASVLTGLAPQDLEVLLAHELAHIRRYDYLVNLLQNVVETLLFYHPAVWWVSRCVRIEREHCCDDLAVGLCGDPLCYARALSELEALRGRSPELAVAADGADLLARVRRILGLPAPNGAWRPSWLAGSVVLVTIASLVATVFLSAGAGQHPAEAGLAEQAAPPDAPRPDEPAPAANSRLEKFWREWDDVDAKEREVARRRWDALTVVEQAELVRRGWTQQPAPVDAASGKPSAMSEAQARKFLDDAQRQLGEHWTGHLARQILDLLTREEREGFEKERRALAARIAALGEPVVGPLIDEIRAEGGRHTLPATQALKQTGRPAVPALLQAVTSTERQPRWILLDILAEAKDPRTRETFVRLLDDRDAHTRLGAWEGLQKLGPVPEDLCLGCLEDEYDSLRRAAIESLAEVGGEQAIPALLEVARHDLHQDKGGGFFLRRIAVDALKQIGQRTGKTIELPGEETWKREGRPSFEMLCQAARCTNPGIRHDAISRLGWWSREQRALDLVLNLLQSERVAANRAAAVAAVRDLLGQTRDDTKRPPFTQAELEPVFNAVLDLARDQDAFLSSRALADISAISGKYLPAYPRFPELFALALDAVEGPDRARQLAGLTVLRRVGSSHPEALKQHLTPERRARLVSRLKSGMEDREVGYRIRFIEMLGYLRERSVVPRLIELLTHEDATVRLFAILALGHIGDRRALPSLEKAAATDAATNPQGERYLRRAAQQAVQQIRSAPEPTESPDHGQGLGAENGQPMEQLQDEPRGRVVGKVVNDANGEPVAKVYVAVDHSGDAGGSNLERFRKQGLYVTAETDREGRFTLDGVAFMDRHPFMATHPGFVRHERTIGLSAEKSPLELEIRLRPAATVVVTAVDAQGQPLAGRTLLRLETKQGPPFKPLRDDWPASNYRTETTNDGGYTFGELDTGVYAAQVMQQTRLATTYHGMTPEIAVQAGKTKQVRVLPDHHRSRVGLEIAADPYATAQMKHILLVIARDPGLLLWQGHGRFYHPEDERLGRIQRQAWLQIPVIPSDEIAKHELHSFPPGTYAVFAITVGTYPNFRSPSVYVRGAMVKIADGEQAVNIPWSEPQGPSGFEPIAIRSLDMPIALEARQYSGKELCELMTRATDGKAQFLAGASVEDEKVTVLQAKQMSIGDLLEMLNRERACILGGEHRTFVLQPQPVR